MCSQMQMQNSNCAKCCLLWVGMQHSCCAMRHLLYAGMHHSDCDMCCVLYAGMWHSKFCHVLLHAQMWHSVCAMHCCMQGFGTQDVPCVVCRDTFMACRGTTCLFIMAVSDVPHGNCKLQKQKFGELWRMFIWRYLITHRDVHFKVPLASMTVPWAVYLVELTAQLL